jgi:UDP-N-acetylglucosamine 2-epimerase (non-hydrolysing)
MYNVLFVFGTRPEVIKLAPVIRCFKSDPEINVTVCITGQHREMLDQMLSAFNIVADYDLNVMTPGQGLVDLCSNITLGLTRIFKIYTPDIVLVQGDTTTAFAAALTAYYHKISVGHIEAGLRTSNLYSPWPEEGNRRLIASIARFHFAPTLSSRESLLKENISDANIYLTGNTIVDALQDTVSLLNKSPRLIDSCRNNLPYNFDSTKPYILVTCHRREVLEFGAEQIFLAIRKISTIRKIQVLFPVHLNPIIRAHAQKVFSGVKNVFICPPQDYVTFVWLLSNATLVITDSGGVQEEASILGKSVLITRETTERPEAVCQNRILVGMDSALIYSEACKFLDGSGGAVPNNEFNTKLYGDGKASIRILNYLKGEVFK